MAERWDFADKDRVMDYRREQKRFYPYFVMNGKGRYRTVSHWERHIYRKFYEYDFKGNELSGFKTFCLNAKTRCGVYALFANVGVKLMFGLVLAAALLVLFFEGYRNAVIDFVKGIIDFFGSYIGTLDVSKAAVFVVIALIIALLISTVLYLLLKTSTPMLDRLAAKIRFYEMLAEQTDKFAELMKIRINESAEASKTIEEFPVLGKTAGEIEKAATEELPELTISEYSSEKDTKDKNARFAEATELSESDNAAIPETVPGFEAADLNNSVAPKNATIAVMKITESVSDNTAGSDITDNANALSEEKKDETNNEKSDEANIEKSDDVIFERHDEAVPPRAVNAIAAIARTAKRPRKQTVTAE